MLPKNVSGQLCRLINLPFIADVDFDGDNAVSMIHRVYHKDGRPARSVSAEVMDSIHEELNREKFDSPFTDWHVYHGERSIEIWGPGAKHLVVAQKRGRKWIVQQNPPYKLKVPADVLATAQSLLKQELP